MSAEEELLVRIGLAAVEVHRIRKRKAAAEKARARCRCAVECNVSGGPKRLREHPPCWKNPRVYEGAELECKACRRRWIRHAAVVLEGRALAGARRRVTMLARNYRKARS
ncbi:MAG: hypothetical protein GY898_23090 [Proteobacteria bacterium]|nr:hypothetical protein [Pseudomonadota bacterium]